MNTTKIETIKRALQQGEKLSASDICALIGVPLTGKDGGAYRYMARIAARGHYVIKKINGINHIMVKEE